MNYLNQIKLNVLTIMTTKVLFQALLRKYFKQLILRAESTFGPRAESVQRHGSAIGCYRPSNDMYSESR